LLPKTPKPRAEILVNINQSNCSLEYVRPLKARS